MYGALALIVMVLNLGVVYLFDGQIPRVVLINSYCCQLELGGDNLGTPHFSDLAHCNEEFNHYFFMEGFSEFFNLKFLLESI